MLSSVDEFVLTADVGLTPEVVGYTNFCLLPDTCPPPPVATNCSAAEDLRTLPDVYNAASYPNTVGLCSIVPPCPACTACDYYIEAQGYAVQNAPATSVGD